ncbi:MBL fold metallo-hydrolase [Candidatus Chlamydia sanziniae]|uniref:Metal-dependent hydrolases of the beta-lactamase superfamily I-PhnP protein n=1 Tax=Candidatus Chlamydia sanziniae TaxID=1806891 RepID=A0A1A9HWG1_9CHLA|nr:MBL fold metallo-hydrolase [Candidatus Chlamydia sanziniae]ANH78266.1 Metal-dependent hydrolases of the beta-lactamase superfamily I - PhnP protein [Candidatus Chlamydia sanziniae]
MKTDGGHDVAVGKLIFLGTGNSEGIPVPFCMCSVCIGKKVQRWRPSVLIQYQDKNYIIDTGPDFREQMLTSGISKLDGVFLTHPHYDHIGGIDDLRAWYIVTRDSLPLVLSASTYRYLEKSKAHLVLSATKEEALPAVLEFKILHKLYGEDIFRDLPYTYLSYYQKSCHVLGYRFGNLAYLTDLARYDREIFNYLHNVDTVILSACTEELPEVFRGRLPSHLTVPQAEAFAEHVGAKHLIITHIGHNLEEERENYPHVVFAYDGMEVSWRI